MASRSAARASSIMRSNRRRMAASVNGPGLLRSAFWITSFSRSGWYSGIFAACLSLPISRAQCERSFKSSTSFLSISSMRRRQSLRFMADFLAIAGRRGSWGDLAAGEAVAGGLLERANAVAEGRSAGVNGLRLFNFGDKGGADDGGVGKSAKNGYVAGKRDAEADGNGKFRCAASPPQERGKIIGQGILRAGD